MSHHYYLHHLVFSPTIKKYNFVLYSPEVQGPSVPSGGEEMKEEEMTTVREIPEENQNLKSVMMSISRAPFLVNSHHFFFLNASEKDVSTDTLIVPHFSLTMLVCPQTPTPCSLHIF